MRNDMPQLNSIAKKCNILCTAEAAKESLLFKGPKGFILMMDFEFDMDPVFSPF